MKNRIKVKLPQLETRDDAEAAVGAVALLTISQQKTTAKMDAELTAIRQKYEASLSEINASLKLETDKLRAWAEANPDEFPKGRKSIQFVQGTIGFRTGTPKVVLLNRSWNWKKVLKAIHDFSLTNFIRVKEEVDRDAILSSNSQAKDPVFHANGVLRPIGVKIAKEESFFIEPNLTEVETRQTVPLDGDGYNGAGSPGARASSEF